MRIQFKGEDLIQRQIIEWCELHKNKYKYIEKITHCPNGGKRSITEATRFKLMGVRAGYPDLFLPVPRNKHHGLYIELKTEKGKLSDKQKEWLEFLHSMGYKVSTCYGFDSAIEVLKEYYK